MPELPQTGAAVLGLCHAQGMTVGTLIAGLLALLALLIAAGGAGAGVGPSEVAIWLLLVAAWVLWWTRSRHTPQA
jgi:hypothetical protein